MSYKQRDGSTVVSISRIVNGEVVTESAPDRNPIIDDSLLEFQKLTPGFDEAEREYIDGAFVKVIDMLLMGNFGEP